MVTQCKTCKQIMPPRGLPKTLRLSPLAERIWTAVRDHPGITSSELMGLVYPGEFWGAPQSFEVLRVTICRMNKYLRQLRPPIEISARERRGYRVRSI